MSYKVAVVIPVSLKPPTFFEKISLRQVYKVLNNYVVNFIVPENTQIPWLEQYSHSIIQEFPVKFFGSAYAHNKLLLSKEFYQRFIEYDYILLYHLDAFIFYDKLLYFCELGYDYIASPHKENEIVIGDKIIKNGLFGGFCLRNPKAFLQALNQYENKLKEWYGQEDCFFSWYAQDSQLIKLAPREIALSFSLETDVKKMFRRNKNKLPMGLHGWWKRDFEFIQPYIEKEGYYLGNDISFYIKESRDIRWRKIKINEYLFSRIIKHEKREKLIKDYFVKKYGESKLLLIWGAGKDGIEFYKCVKGIFDVSYFVDNDKDKWEKNVGGIKIKKPNLKEVRSNKVFIFIATKTYCEEITVLLKNNGLKNGVNFISVIEFEQEIINLDKEMKNNSKTTVIFRKG